MFFVGFSCSILPYILAIFFAWIFVGNATAKNTRTNKFETEAKAKVVEYQASKVKVSNVYHYHKFFEELLVTATKPRQFLILNCWREFCADIPISDVFLINPIKRGPPQVL